MKNLKAQKGIVETNPNEDIDEEDATHLAENFINGNISYVKGIIFKSANPAALALEVYVTLQDLSEEDARSFGKVIRRSSINKEATVVDKTWDKVDFLREVLGDGDFIENYIRAEEDTHCNENLDYIIQNYDLGEEWRSVEKEFGRTQEDKAEENEKTE